MTKKVYAEANVRIGSEVVRGAHALRDVMSDVASDDARMEPLTALCAEFTKRVYERLPDANTADLLMLSDMVANYALAHVVFKQDSGVAGMDLITRQWALAKAMHVGLLPVPDMAQTDAAVAAAAAQETGHDN